MNQLSGCTDASKIAQRSRTLNQSNDNKVISTQEVTVGLQYLDVSVAHPVALQVHKDVQLLKQHA
jgi:hypothetical protein